jgi:microcystin-dependent protein
MSTPFLGEIKIMSFNFAPKGWAQCDGQLLPINQNQALFSLLGTSYGGNGTTNFGLPDMRGRTGLHVGNGLTQGERAGAESVTLQIGQLPAHTHTAVGNGTANGANAPAPSPNFWADAGKPLFASSANNTMAAQAITSVGGSQPHENRSPYLTLNLCIALQGIFPSRN